MSQRTRFEPAMQLANRSLGTMQEALMTVTLSELRPRRGDIGV
jgi:hypothetical protein